MQSGNAQPVVRRKRRRPAPPDPIWGIRIRQLRRAYSITQGALGEACILPPAEDGTPRFLSARDISVIERGLRMPKISTFKSIVAAFRSLGVAVSADWFLSLPKV